jgi:hypothetical protein
VVHGHIPNTYDHLRPLQQVVAHGHRQHGRCQHQRRTDADDARGAIANVIGRALGRAHMAQQRLGRSKKITPGAGQRDLSGRAIEEAESDNAFELRDQLTDRLCREAQA